MNSELKKHLGGLALKISAMVVGLSLLFFVANSMLSIGKTYNNSVRDTYQAVETAMDQSLSWIDSRLEIVEVVTHAMATNPIEQICDPQQCRRLLTEVINSCEYIEAVTLEFDPTHNPYGVGEYAPSVYVDATIGDTLFTDISKKGFRYIDPADKDDNWLAGVQGKCTWSRPYQSRVDSIMRVAYSCPMYDQKGQVAAVLCSTVTLGWIRGVFEKSKPHPDCQQSVITTNGDYVLKMNTQKTGRGNALKDALVGRDSTILDVTRRMMNGEKGKATITDPARKFLYYSPIPRTGWSACYIYPMDLIYQAPMKLARNLFLQGLLLFLLMFVVITWGIYHYIRPFSQNLEKVTESNAAMNRDLKIAAGLQRTMLPRDSSAPIGCGQLQVCGTLRPAKMVGGDLYDYFFHGGRIYFCVGDVSGKGVPASMYMAIIRILIREIANRETEVDRILLQLNQSMTKSDNSMFCTVFLGCIDLSSGRITYSSAGHNPPVLVRCGTDGPRVEFLSVDPSAAVGVFDDETFHADELSLNPGDSIFLYTDGVTESENPDHRLYGEEAVLQALAAMDTTTPLQEVVTRMMASVDAWADGAVQSDDITMLMLRYAPTSSLTLTNDIRLTTRLGEWVQTMCQRYELPPERLFNIQLAIEEAVVNVMNYAYPGQKDKPIYISVQKQDDMVCFVVEDEGVPYDPTANDKPDIDASVEDCQIGGLGVFLYSELLDRVEYKYEGGRNKLLMGINKAEII